MSPCSLGLMPIKLIMELICLMLKPPDGRPEPLDGKYVLIVLSVCSGNLPSRYVQVSMVPCIKEVLILVQHIIVYMQGIVLACLARTLVNQVAIFVGTPQAIMACAS